MRILFPLIFYGHFPVLIGCPNVRRTSRFCENGKVHLCVPRHWERTRTERGYFVIHLFHCHVNILEGRPQLLSAVPRSSFSSWRLEIVLSNDNYANLQGTNVRFFPMGLERPGFDQRISKLQGMNRGLVWILVDSISFIETIKNQYLSVVFYLTVFPVGLISPGRSAGVAWLR